MPRSSGLAGSGGSASFSLSRSFRAPLTDPFRGPSRVFLTRPGGLRSRCSAPASLSTLGSPCEFAPSVSSQIAFPGDGSLEVLRLHSARGSADRIRVLRPESLRLLGSSHMTASSQPALPTDPVVGGTLEISPSEHAPHPDRYRFPGPGPLAVSRRRSNARTRAASGLRSPDGVDRDRGSISSSSLRVSL